MIDDLQVTNDERAMDGKGIASIRNRKSQIADVLTAAQAALVDEIKLCHAGANKAFDHQAQYVFLCGLKLQALKESVPHGNKEGDGFLAILAAHFPELPKRTAQVYMHFSKLLREKSANVALLSAQSAQLTNGELPEKSKNEVLKAVYEACDGKVWTAVYRDMNKVRGPEHQKHTPAKPQSPEDILAGKIEMANAPMDRAIGELMNIIQTEAMWNEHLGKGKRKELAEQCRAYLRVIKPKKSVAQKATKGTKKP